MSSERKEWIFIWVMAACLQACAGVSPSERVGELGLEVPGSFDGGSSVGQVDNDWVRGFGDKTLDGLVVRALAGNPDMTVASARLEQARSAARIAASARKPTADLVINGRRARQNFVGFPILGGGDEGEMRGGDDVLAVTQNTFGVSLDLGWEVDLWGRIRAGESAALAEVQVAAAEVAAGRASLAAQVAKAYFALALAEEESRLAEQALEIQTETEQVIRERFAGGQRDGDGTGAQLRLAMSDVEAGRAEVQARKNDRDAAARQLEILLGSYPHGEVSRVLRLPELASTPPAGLPSELLRRRPDLVAAERRLAAAGERINEAWRAVFPRLQLTGSAGTSTDTLGNLLSSDFGVWNLAGGVVQPILTGGVIRAEAENRRSQERIALAEYQKAVLQAFFEVEQALSAEVYLRLQEEALGAAVELAEEAYVEALVDYRGGVGEILTVFTTQGRYLQTRNQLVALRRARLDNRVNLHLALGGGFSVSN